MMRLKDRLSVPFCIPFRWQIDSDKPSTVRFDVNSNLDNLPTDSTAFHFLRQHHDSRLCTSKLPTMRMLRYAAAALFCVTPSQSLQRSSITQSVLKMTASSAFDPASSARMESSSLSSTTVKDTQPRVHVYPYHKYNEIVDDSSYASIKRVHYIRHAEGTHNVKMEYRDP